MILYVLLTARKPFDGPCMGTVIKGILHDEPEPPSALQPGIPPDLDEILR